MALRFLGTAVTDSNGNAVLSDGYTGTGAGSVDFVAGCTVDDSTVVSVPYPVLDCITTTNDKSIWTVIHYATKENTTNGVVFTQNGNNTSRVALYLGSERLCLPLSDDWEFEFDIFSNLISFYFTDDTSSDGVFIAYNGNNCADCMPNIDLTTTNHIKFVYSSSEHKIRTYRNDSTTAENKVLDTSSFSHDIGFTLIDWNKDMDCTISNLKICRI